MLSSSNNYITEVGDKVRLNPKCRFLYRINSYNNSGVYAVTNSFYIKKGSRTVGVVRYVGEKTTYNGTVRVRPNTDTNDINNYIISVNGSLVSPVVKNLMKTAGAPIGSKYQKSIRELLVLGGINLNSMPASVLVNKYFIAIVSNSELEKFGRSMSLLTAGKAGLISKGREMNIRMLIDILSHNLNGYAAAYTATKRVLGTSYRTHIMSMRPKPSNTLPPSSKLSNKPIIPYCRLCGEWLISYLDKTVCIYCGNPLGNLDDSFEIKANRSVSIEPLLYYPKIDTTMELVRFVYEIVRRNLDHLNE